jgi:hypothetical protein
LEQVDPAAGCEAGRDARRRSSPTRERAPTPDRCPVKGPVGDDKKFTVWF